MSYELIDNPDKIDVRYIEDELKSGKEITVQFSSIIYTEPVLAALDRLCLMHDEQFKVRFYGHYNEPFDCSTLLHIPHVKNLSIDSLTIALNTDAISKLTEITNLSIGIFELEDTEILAAENFRQLRKLSIGDTRKNAINLAHLKGMKNLHSLIVSGHTKNIEAAGELEHLENLTLNSIKKTRLAFVNTLRNLKSLRILLGGRENISEIGNNNIEHLEIVWVRGLNDLANLSDFNGLKTLVIEDQAQLKKIDFTRELPRLNEIKLVNCKLLESLSGLHFLHNLQSLMIVKTNIDFDDLCSKPLPGSLKKFSFYSGKTKVDEMISQKLSSKGYTEV